MKSVSRQDMWKEVNGGGSDLIGMVEIDFEADDTLYSNLTI
jgi:hypothetical protein